MASKRELLSRIEKLENTVQQLTEMTIEIQEYDYSNYGYFERMYGVRPPLVIKHTPTLKADVESIKDFLGITVDYIPEEVKTKVTPAEIKAVAIKKKQPKAKAKKASKK